MDDHLLPWLRATIAKAEDRARAATRVGGGATWSVEPFTPTSPDALPGSVWVVDEAEDGIAMVNGDARARHIADNDPRTVLAQCESHTAILDRHLPRREHAVDGDLICPTCASFVDDEDQGGNRSRSREHEDWPCPTVLAVALAFQHCDGYRDEWKP